MFVLLLFPGLALAERPVYLDTIPVFWRNLYPDGGQGLYCGHDFRARDRSYNIEHVYPMAWVTRALRCGDRQSCRRTSARFNEIESDMHNMYPARPAVRGDIARAMLYMAERYEELVLYERQRRLLLDWHRQDPPDDAERQRNRRVAEIQGRPNPWIE
jgi:deoxyribonuclease-1